MNTRQLEYVVAVYETRSFSEAAKQLYVSQPSLSQYVKKIEQEIGTEIFVRTTPLKLTYQGEIFVRYAKRVLEEEKQLEAVMNDISANRTGCINLGAGPLNSSTVVPRLTADFIREYPDVEINICEEQEEGLAELLDSGETDFILTVMEPPVDSNYVIEEVAREQYVLAIPAGLDVVNDPRASGKVKKYQEIPSLHIGVCRKIPYIMQADRMPAHVIFENLCREEGFVPKAKVICRNINTAVAFAQTGAGACFVPFGTVKERETGLNCYRVEGDDSDRVIRLIYRKSMALSQLQKAYMEKVRAYFAAYQNG